MDSKSVVTKSRKWNNPNIFAWVNDEEVGAAMKLSDFTDSVGAELSRTLPCEIAKLIGSPAMIFTQAQLEARLNYAIKSAIEKQMPIASDNVEMEMHDKTAAVV